MEAQLLEEAISEYQQSLTSITEALEASPDEGELIDLKAQLEAALHDAEAALAGLRPEPASAAPAGAPSKEAPGAGGAPTALPRSAPPASNNARIHPRSRYAHEEPNFEALAARHPSLAPFLVRTSAAAAAAAGGDAPQPAAAGRASLDFASPAACRELTRVLLAEDFGIQWWVPLGQLVPPITNRANYIHWLEDLLSLSAPKGPVAGLDVGCGANLIYPLLAATLCGWRMVGADVTPAALRWAARNLGANPQLRRLVELRHVAMQPDQAELLGGGGDGGGAGSVGRAAAADPVGDALAEDEAGDVPAALAAATPAPVVRLGGAAAGRGLVSGALRAGERLAFCMCNPPFFESMAEAGRNPATAYGGTPAEMVYPGGELAFVTALVQDSLALRGAVHWYSTMVGKKATLRAARSLLYRHGVRVLRTTEFCQGKTSRWALAWSFAAPASAASQPLPRFAAAAGAAAAATPAPLRAARKLSWQVSAPPAAGSAVLGALQSCLEAAGVRYTLDRAAYCLRCTYPPSPAELAAAGDEAAGGPPAAKRQRQAEARPGGGGAAPHAGASQAPATEAPPELAAPRGEWKLELRLFQQHAGLFLLSAALLPSAPDAALPWWGALAARLRDALAARWKVAG